MTRGSEHSLIKALRAIPDLASLDDSTLLEIVGCSMNLHWSAGSLVFEEGKPGEALFVVLSGCVQIFDTGGGGEREVAIVEPGDYFGELSVLLDATHSKSARVLEDAELLVIPKGPFQEIVRVNPELEGYLRERVEARLANDARAG